MRQEAIANVEDPWLYQLALDCRRDQRNTQDLVITWSSSITAETKEEEEEEILNGRNWIILISLYFQVKGFPKKYNIELEFPRIE